MLFVFLLYTITKLANNRHESLKLIKAEHWRTVVETQLAINIVGYTHMDPLTLSIAEVKPELPRLLDQP
jgi:hypothetical protein